MYTKHRKQRRKSRYMRKIEIMSVFYYWHRHDGMTMRQIAFWVQVSPSTHLMNILKELQADGKLCALEAPHRSNTSKFLWRLSPQGVEFARSSNYDFGRKR